MTSHLNQYNMKIMKKRIRIQIIGNYLNKIRYSLNRAGIYTEDFLANGNPLGIVSLSDDDKKDIAFPEVIQTANNKVTQLTLRKNLDEYLSHNEDVFKSNEKIPGIGKAVRLKNTSSYVIICNTNLVYPLFLYKDNLYSGTSPENEFSEYLRQEGAVNVIPSVCFNNIRSLFDKYIEILLKEYDRNHIILIKTAPSLWYLENGNFKLFDDNTARLRKFINEADNYFIEKTHCAVVNTFERFVPDGLLKESLLPCAYYPDFAYDELSADVISLINDIENRQVSVRKDAEKNTSFRENLHSAGEEEFLQFLVEKSKDGSSVSVKDISFIEKYTESKHIDLDGLTGIFMLAGQASPQNDFSKIAFNLLHNDSCSAVAQSLHRYKNNREYLNHYSYFRGIIPEINGAYIRMNHQYILGILPEQDIPIQLIPFRNQDTVDEKKVMDNGFFCSIHEAEALCKSMRFYVQRAKHGQGNHPVRLKYESKDSFLQSLYVLDYAYLLSNEPFLIGIEAVAAKDFRVRTNLDFLFCEKTRIVKIRNGLSDQISQYFLSKCIQYEGMDVYYDDLHVRSINADLFGYELDKVIHEKIDGKCFSVILSGELVKSFDAHEMDLPDVLFEAGICQLVAVADNKLFNFSGYKKCSRLLFEVSPEQGYENLKYLIRGFGSYVAYYFCVIRPEFLMLHYPLCLNQLCQFPEFEDEINTRLQCEMIHNTVIGVHIRRGDYTHWGETDHKYYREVIRKVISIPEYRAAKIYVFSDDIPWCRANAETLGLLQAGRENLVYISHNTGDNSFRDMQLLTFCKVIIGQQGGFARMAYVLSRNSEMFITPEESLYELFRKIGRGNKYDISLNKTDD